MHYTVEDRDSKSRPFAMPYDIANMSPALILARGTFAGNIETAINECPQDHDKADLALGVCISISVAGVAATFGGAN